MSVVSLSGKPITKSARRETVLNAVAASFDLYVDTYGFEPEAAVYTLSGVKQPSLIAWDISGESEDGVTSVLCMAAVHVQTEASQSRQGLNTNHQPQE